MASNVTQLGQAAPAVGSVAVSSGGSLANSTDYKVGLTFYSSVTGFETNVYESAQVTTSSPNLQIDVTAIPTTADNATIDKVRVYLKNITTNTSYLYATELDLGTTSYTVTTVPTSTITPPTTHATPLAGGGKYPAVFGKSLVYAGNGTYKSDLFISEEYIPDAWDDTTTSKTLEIPGQGEITGVAVGLYDNNYLNPYIIIFKKTTTVLYSELGGTPVQTTIDEHVGCVSHDTIRVRNGNVYFMSENGWYMVVNGSIPKEKGAPISLGGGDIDDIFSREGWVYQLNSDQFENFFSVYYPTLGHYMTFVAEAGNGSIYKAYNFEEKIGGFRAYEFKSPLKCACEGEDDNGNQCVFIGDTTGTLFTHSVKNGRYDEDESGTQKTISAYFYLPFMVGNEDAVTYNFRTLTIKAISSTDAVTVKAFPSYSLANGSTSTFDFSNSVSGFILDVSQLDVGVLAEDRLPKKYIADVNSTGEAMTIGFFQDILSANMGIISAELQFNRNGNGNL
jgi:hypothetical protein